MDLRVLLESPQRSQSSSRVGACTFDFLPSCSSSVTLPFAWIKGFVSLSGGFPTRLSHEAFPRGFPTGLYHVPPCCESIGLRHLGHSGNGGMTLEFLSPFLWIAPPLEMRRECREFFPEHEGKGSLVSSYEVETGLLWMWAGLWCFLCPGA